MRQFCRHFSYFVDFSACHCGFCYSDSDASTQLHVSRGNVYYFVANVLLGSRNYCQWRLLHGFQPDKGNFWYCNVGIDRSLKLVKTNESLTSNCAANLRSIQILSVCFFLAASKEILKPENQIILPAHKKATKHKDFSQFS